jgi:hypothetical protein
MTDAHFDSKSVQELGSPALRAYPLGTSTAETDRLRRQADELGRTPAHSWTGVTWER